MRPDIKKPNKDLRNYYMLFLELGLVIVLLGFIVATKVDFDTGQSEINLVEEQEVVKMEEVVQTEQQENKPPPPPRPQIPVEVPNDEIIEEQDINLNADLNLDEAVDIPTEPPGSPEEEEKEEEEDFFVAVEQMPELKGSLGDLQRKINYPERARQAGIEGRVIIQFIVNEEGEVEDPRVIRGIGGGCDEEALRVVKMAKFKPGMQRGRTVRVRYSLPFVFMLKE